MMPTLAETADGAALTSRFFKPKTRRRTLRRPPSPSNRFFEVSERTQLRSSKYLNDLIEQDHRSIKLRPGLMVGFKRFRHSSVTIAGIELMRRIRKGQYA